MWATWRGQSCIADSGCCTKQILLYTDVRNVTSAVKFEIFYKYLMCRSSFSVYPESLVLTCINSKAVKPIRLWRLTTRRRLS